MPFFSPYRLALHQLTESLDKGDSVKLAKVYGLSPAKIGNIQTSHSPSVQLLEYLEQQAIVKESAVKQFYDQLIQLGMPKAAAAIRVYYPDFPEPQVQLQSPVATGGMPTMQADPSRYNREPSYEPLRSLPSDLLPHLPISVQNSLSCPSGYPGMQPGGNPSQPQALQPEYPYQSSHHPLQEEAQDRAQQVPLDQPTNDGAVTTSAGTPLLAKHIADVAQLIGSEWRQIALQQLDLKKAELDHCEEDGKNLSHKIFLMFDKWKAKQKRDATVENLMIALENFNNLDPDVMKYLREQIN